MPAMYDPNYECRYARDDIFLESDGASEVEKEFVLDVLYREDFVNLFGIGEAVLDQEADVLFDGVIRALYERVRGHAGLVECMKLAAAKFFSEDEETGLCVLYSYDYMALTHACVSALLLQCDIPEDALNALKTKVSERH